MSDLNRRTVLKGVGLGALATGLAGCTDVRGPDGSEDRGETGGGDEREWLYESQGEAPVCWYDVDQVFPEDCPDLNEGGDPIPVECGAAGYDECPDELEVNTCDNGCSANLSYRDNDSRNPCKERLNRFYSLAETKRGCP